MAGALHNTGPWWRSGTPLYRTWNLSRSYVWAVHNGIVGVHTFQVSTARRAPKCLARSFKPEVPQVSEVTEIGGTATCLRPTLWVKTPHIVQTPHYRTLFRFIFHTIGGEPTGALDN
jgi:hypothetical protein